MVNRRAFGIIGNSSLSGTVFQQPFLGLGSGRKTQRKGGPPEARRLFERQKPVSRDVAAVRSGAQGSGRRWRAEVGPTLRSVRPRPHRFGSGPVFSFERLIFAEVGDGDAEGVNRNQFIGYLGLEEEYKIRSVKIALELAMVGWRVIDHVEVPSRTKGRRLHLFQRDFLYIHVDFRRGRIGDELLDDVVFAIGVEDAVRELAVEEVKRLREIVLNR